MMIDISSVIFYSILFFSLYVQVFLLITYIDSKKSRPNEEKQINPSKYPTASVLIPCWNEENTIKGTIESALALKYPKDKLKIVLIDDGSTDKTLEIMHSYDANKQIVVFHQENQGKHVALNLAIKNTYTDLIATLDADSFIAPEALERVVNIFNKDSQLQAVASSILIHNPKNLIQLAQKAEYEMSVYVKHMLAKIGGLHVTPGPFSVFKREIFDSIGMYKRAYNTEDIEMALRIQKNGYKIGYCSDSYVYTVSPDTVVKLFKQRIRWTYGFFKNLNNYRGMIFNKKHSGLAFFTLPASIIALTIIPVVLSFALYSVGSGIINLYLKVSAAGIDSLIPSFDPFNLYISTTTIVITILYFSVILAVMIGRRLSREKLNSWKDIILMVIMSATVAPVWVIKSMVDAARSRQSEWK
ncbi:MAG: biofilm PGA synthesis N-glycosyltransferase PgaC [Candidatus Paceibacteria bacterium]|jgi:biofilm PGA synthesis N-glycosyltransferase PgaC